MGKRIDYFNDPSAPKANSVVPSANVVVVNDAGEILLIRRTDNDNWALPGGAMDLGESLTDAAIRETAEETGILVEITGLVGIYTDPRHVILYTSNGEVRQECSVVFTARPVSGEPTPSSESREVYWVPPDTASSLAMDRSMRMRIEHYLVETRSRTLASEWVNAGVSVFSAVGTVGAFIIGFVPLLREHRREAERSEDERRAQAARISAWVDVYRRADGTRELAFHIHNASDMPIYDVELPSPHCQVRRPLPSSLVCATCQKSSGAHVRTMSSTTETTSCPRPTGAHLRHALSLSMRL